MDNTNRLDFSPTTKKTIRRDCNDHCIRPGCGRRLIQSGLSSGSSSRFIGDVCHIHAASPGGPRYNPNLTAAEIRAATNGITLCRICHTVVDSDEMRFTAELLRLWKETFLDRRESDISGINKYDACKKLALFMGHANQIKLASVPNGAVGYSPRPMARCLSAEARQAIGQILHNKVEGQDPRLYKYSPSRVFSGEYPKLVAHQARIIEAVEVLNGSIKPGCDGSKWALLPGEIPSGYQQFAPVYFALEGDKKETEWLDGLMMDIETARIYLQMYSNPRLEFRVTKDLADI